EGEVGDGSGADEKVDALSRPDAGPRSIALDERRAVFRLRINARVGELPVGGAGQFVLAADAVPVSPSCGGRLGPGHGSRAGQAKEQLTTIQRRHGCISWKVLPSKVTRPGPLRKRSL